VRGRKLELEHFLNQQGVDVCLLSEVFLKPGKTFRLANYVCHHTDRLTTGGGTVILIRRGIVHHSVPVLALAHLLATTVQITLASKPMLNLVAYHSTSRQLIGENLIACFGGGLPALMAGDLNAKHVDWNLLLSTRRGKLLREYADENFCLIFGPDSPTTNPYNPFANPDFLDIVLTKRLSFPVYLTSSSALSSDHLPVLINTAYLSTFHHPPDRPDIRCTDWAKFHANLEDLIPFDPELHNEMALDTYVENFHRAVLTARETSTPKRPPR